MPVKTFKYKITVDELRSILINPFYAVNFHEGLFGEHPPMVSKKEWVKAQIVDIEEEGLENWLNRLLDVLEGKYA